MEILAHKNQETGEEQNLSEHLLNVGVTSAKNGSVIKQGAILYLIGILHDLGKADRKFQEKITTKPNMKVKHSAAGAKYLERYIKTEYIPKGNVLKEDYGLFGEYLDVVSYVILAHHGLFDIWTSHSEENNLYFRMQYDQRKDDEIYYFEEDVVKFANDFFMENDINLSELIADSFKEFKFLSGKLSTTDETEKHFYSGLKMRLYLSMLKNADITDTINAYKEELNPLGQEYLKKKKDLYMEAVEQVYAEFSEPVTEIDEVRNRLAVEAKERGIMDAPGVYRLNLPTGAGKTLLSLRYGVHQMKYQNKDRLVYITPFLSVLEQNAEEIKNILKDKHITEHHSNMVDNSEEKTDEDEDTRENMLFQYMMDSWDSPVILSTMVQFFQTLFKEKSNNLRRFSSLANSVIILDEVQSLPIEVTHLFNMTMNFISRVMDSVIILCTATQPAYDSDYIKYQINYQRKDKKDIVKMSEMERESFDRTTVSKLNEGESSNEEEIIEEILEHPDDSTLVILNTKKAVNKVVEVLKNQTSRPVYYLSTNLCPQHRKNLIHEMKCRLSEESVICVSTQLIEAGVDISFNRLIRSYAGIDSIVQSIGRCNRNGELKSKGQVKLVKTEKEFENIDVSALKSIKEKASVTEKILRNENAEINITELNDKFYDNYFANTSSNFDYSFGKDKGTGVDLLSKNRTLSIANKKRFLNQSFKSAGQMINLINQETVPVIVYYRESEEMIEELITMLGKVETEYNFEEIDEIKKILNKLQPYTVNLYNIDKLGQAIMKYFDGSVNILIKDNYDEEMLGVIEEASDFVM